MEISLESILRKKLGISETIEIRKVFSFINKHDGKDLKTLPLVNFQNEKVYRMTDSEITAGIRHTILFYEKKTGIFRKNYLLYCKRNDGDYVKVYSNKKINREIEFFNFREEEVDDNLFISYPISFTPVSIKYYEKLNIVYREIVIC